MANDTRQKALEALEQIIRVGNIFATVTTNPKHSVQFNSGDFPLCMILEGPSVSDHALTSTEFEVISVGFRVIYKQESDEDTARSEQTGRNLVDDLKILLAQNVQLNDTCDWFLADSDDPPFAWDTMTNKFRDFVYLMRIRREFGSA